MGKSYWTIHWIRQQNLDVVRCALKETLIFMEKVDLDRQENLVSNESEEEIAYAKDMFPEDISLECLIILWLCDIKYEDTTSISCF